MLTDLLLHDYKTLQEHVATELERLKVRQYQLDVTIVDLQHEIEFSNVDACTMVAIFKHQKEVFVERRNVKNDLAKLFQVNGAFKNFKGVINSCAGLDTRKYKPRVLHLDFTNSRTLLDSRKKLESLGC